MDTEAPNKDTAPLVKSFEDSFLWKNRLIIIVSIICAFVAVFLIVFLVIYLRPHNNNGGNSSNPSYTIWCVGQCSSNKVVSKTENGVVLMGGGTDVESAFVWQIQNAKGGDFLILRTSGADGYNDWVYNLAILYKHPLNSVRTILFNSKQASYDTMVLNYINNSEAIFFAGGDQSFYVNWWSNTPVQKILQNKLNTITIGGTSAGCAILGISLELLNN